MKKLIALLATVMFVSAAHAQPTGAVDDPLHLGYDLRVFDDPELLGAEQANNAMLRALKGERIDESDRSLREIDLDSDIVGGHGSENIPLIHYTNRVVWASFHAKGELPKLRAAYGRYMDRPLHGKEPGSSFIYGEWNNRCQMVLYSVFSNLGWGKEAAHAYSTMRANAFMMALGAGWEKSGTRWRGYPTTQTGARSWVTARDHDRGGYDQDGDGILDAPYMIAESPLTMVLSLLLDIDKHSKQALGQLVAQIDRNGWPKPVLKKNDRDLALKLVRSKTANRNDLEKAVDALNSGPLPRVGFRYIKTTKATATVGLRSTNPGSTSYLYGRMWYAGGNRPASWMDRLPWNFPRRVGWLNVDPSVRKAGVTGNGEVSVNGGTVTMRAQRESAKGNIPGGTYYDELKGKFDDPKAFVRGWREHTLPGELVWSVEVGRNKAKILFPADSGGGDPPPADDPPQIASVAPTGGHPGTFPTLVIRGSDLLKTQASVSGDGVRVARVLSQADTELRAVLAIEDDASLTARTVSVNGPHGSASSAGTFMVVAKGEPFPDDPDPEPTPEPPAPPPDDDDDGVKKIGLAVVLIGILFAIFGRRKKPKDE